MEGQKAPGEDQQAPEGGEGGHESVAAETGDVKATELQAMEPDQVEEAEGAPEE